MNIPKELEWIAKDARKYKTLEEYEESLNDPFKTHQWYMNPKTEKAILASAFVIRTKGSRDVMFDTKKFWKAARQSVKIPTGMTLQKSLTKTGGQMHFKNDGEKKKAKTLNTKKTKKRVKKIKKGSDNLMTFGIKLPDIRTLEDIVK